MTERLQKAYMLRGQEKDIPVDKQLVIEWIDDKVDTLLKMQELVNNSPESLSMGKLIERKGEYETEIDTCAWDVGNMELRKCFIHRGIRPLADAVGEKIYTEDAGESVVNPNIKMVRHCFKYRGIKFYELEDEGKEPK